MADRIDLVRHPDKEGDAQGIYGGRSATITPKGWQEAEALIQRLMQMPHDSITTSTIPRAKALGSMYAERLGYNNLHFSPLFDEIDKPQWLAGLHRDDPIHKAVTAAIRSTFDNGKAPLLHPKIQREIKCQLGLSLPREIVVQRRAELEARMRKIFEYFVQLPLHSGLVVTHAKLIAAMVQWRWNKERNLKGFYKEADCEIVVNTSGITTFERRPDRRTGEMRWHIVSINDVSHLEAAEGNRLFAMAAQLSDDSSSPSK